MSAWLTSHHPIIAAGSSNQWLQDTLVIRNPQANPSLSWVTLAPELKGQAWICWKHVYWVETRSWDEGISKYGFTHRNVILDLLFTAHFCFHRGDHYAETVQMSLILNNQRQRSSEKWFKTGWTYVSTVFKSKFCLNHLNISRHHYTQLISLLLPSRLHGTSVSCSCGCWTLTEAIPLRYYPAVAHLCLQLVSSETFHLLLPFCICLNQSDHWPLTPGINKSILSRLVHLLHKDR